MKEKGKSVFSVRKKQKTPTVTETDDCYVKGIIYNEKKKVNK